LRVVRQAARIGDAQLLGDPEGDALRHLGRPGEEGAQEPHGAQLHREAQAVVIAAAAVDQRPVTLIEVEKPLKLRHRRRLSDEQIHYKWDNGNEPLIVIDSGDTVVVVTSTWSSCCPFCLGRPARVHLHKGKPTFTTCWFPQQIKSGKFTPLTQDAKPNCISKTDLPKLEQLLQSIA
jgi:hypothetical protein